MRAWVVGTPGPIDEYPLEYIERQRPEPGAGEIRIAVRTCGVCRTDLHLAEGDLAARRPQVIPGHEVVGVVDALGPGARAFGVGERVGIAWLASTCGTCEFCRSDRENLCRTPTFTGWDRDGGYGEFAIADEAFAYSIPEDFDDVSAAPLLCAGIIGYRALRLSRFEPGMRLGIYGFGASAHLTAQIAVFQQARVHVVTRSAAARRLALKLGAASVGDHTETPPEPLDAAILFAPVGSLVPVALGALDRAGTLAIAGIYLSTIPALSYESSLFYEKQLCSVTANTRNDGREFLELAASAEVHVTTTTYPLSRANAALRDLHHGRVEGAAVLVNDKTTGSQE